MNTIMEQESSDFGARIPMVGRKAEMEDLRAWLHEERGRHFVYYRALGGLGKTRILQELQKMAVQAGPGFCFSGIIDLYHTDLHSTSRIERAIAQGLDPERKYFGEYWRRRREFEMLREWGADPQVIEDRRVELSAAFVRACRDLAEDAKLVICFDTVELLQSESSVVEQMAGLETMDVRIKPWLLHHLAELRRNVLVVFAGRPRVPLPGDEERDPQARLEADMRQAFGDDLRVIELGPLTLDETGQFVAVLAAQSDVGTLTLDDRLSVVHLLTGGRPILLHLVVDLLAHLAQEPRLILDLFDRHAGLVGAPPDDPRVAAAREEIERELVHAVFAEEVLLGNYLYRIALLPKGVDAEILGQVLGLSNDGAHDLLRHLAPLSFVKQHVPSQIDDQEADERFFLHDEMYRLLRRPDVVPNLRVNELDVAQRVIERYYDPQIELLTQVVSASLPDERAPQRERLHRLLVDRLYYLLVCDVQKGYEAYRELSDEANRHRQAGLSMRLLDEFLRFYNAPERWEMLGRGKLWHPDERVPERREIPAQAFLLYKQVIRDSVLMWVERLYHWGQHNMAIDFASQALDDPGRVYLRESQDIDILANICALWANARALVNGYEPKTIERAQAMLRRLPPLEGCTPGEALARARLSVAIGYSHRLGGMLTDAAHEYADSIAAFQKEGQHEEEYVRVLNNQAYVHALQGRFRQARIVAHDALAEGERLGYDYTRGLTLNVLSNLARMRENYGGAIEYGNEALELFQRISDPHGIVLARIAVAEALRQQSQHLMRVGRKPDEALKLLQSAERHLRGTLQVLGISGLSAERLAASHAELGRLHRDLGDWYKRRGDAVEVGDPSQRAQELFAQATDQYQRAEELLEQAVQELQADLDKADTRHDLAEVQWAAGKEQDALQTLSQAESSIGPEYQIVPGQPLPAASLPNERFMPLAKVEWLRARISLERGEIELGAQHFLLAHAYLQRFSPEAYQLDRLVDDVHGLLRGLGGSQAAQFVAALERQSVETDLGVDASSFLQVLRDLP